MTGFHPNDPPRYFNGKVGDVSSARHKEVFKVGCVTGLTSGILMFDGMAVRKENIHMKLKDKTYNRIEMYNQMEILPRDNGQHIFRPGDSGSLVFQRNPDTSEVEALGLAIGHTSYGAVIATPLRPILDAFDLQIDMMKFDKQSTVCENHDVSQYHSLDINMHGQCAYSNTTPNTTRNVPSSLDSSSAYATYETCSSEYVGRCITNPALMDSTSAYESGSVTTRNYSVHNPTERYRANKNVGHMFIGKDATFSYDDNVSITTTLPDGTMVRNVSKKEGKGKRVIANGDIEWHLIPGMEHEMTVNNTRIVTK